MGEERREKASKQRYPLVVLVGQPGQGKAKLAYITARHIPAYVTLVRRDTTRPLLNLLTAMDRATYAPVTEPVFRTQRSGGGYAEYLETKEYWYGTRHEEILRATDQTLGIVALPSPCAASVRKAGYRLYIVLIQATDVPPNRRHRPSLTPVTDDPVGAGLDITVTITNKWGKEGELASRDKLEVFIRSRFALGPIRSS